jgi:AbrB family looped-hinge helix DNA binding protein
MLSRKVLAKGQVVIPKTIRQLLGINEGDDMVIDVDKDRIILSKKSDVSEIFSEVVERKGKNISMKDIKRDLEARYEEA